jgi:hypothetical protein
MPSGYEINRRIACLVLKNKTLPSRQVHNYVNSFLKPTDNQLLNSINAGMTKPPAPPTKAERRGTGNVNVSSTGSSIALEKVEADQRDKDEFDRQVRVAVEKAKQRKIDRLQKKQQKADASATISKVLEKRADIEQRVASASKKIASSLRDRATKSSDAFVKHSKDIFDVAQDSKNSKNEVKVLHIKNHLEAYYPDMKPIKMGGTKPLDSAHSKIKRAIDHYNSDKNDKIKSHAHNIKDIVKQSWSIDRKNEEHAEQAKVRHRQIVKLQDTRDYAIKEAEKQIKVQEHAEMRQEEKLVRGELRGIDSDEMIKQRMKEKRSKYAQQKLDEGIQIQEKHDFWYKKKAGGTKKGFNKKEQAREGTFGSLKNLRGRGHGEMR